MDRNDGRFRDRSVEAEENDGIPFEDKMGHLTAEWHAQQTEAERLSTAVSDNLATLGFGPDGVGAQGEEAS